jgi:hypothetical protein
MIHALVTGPFPLDVFVLLGMSFIAGVGWSLAARVVGRFA